MTNFDYTAKIAALLAMASDPSLSEEAAANYRAKASQLQLEKQITDADINRAGKSPEDELGRSVVIGLEKRANVVKAKRDILSGIAPLFNIRVTIAHDRSFMHMHGFESDRKFVQAMFDSLVIQLDGQLAQMRGDRSFKTSFAHGFANTVVSRLRAARRMQETDAASSTPGAELVLRNRKQLADEFYEGFYAGGRMRTSYKNRSIRNAAGLQAGAIAGNRADIGNTRIENTRKSIG